MRYSRRILNYPERLALSDLTHMIIMTDLIAIVVEFPRVDSRCYVEKDLYELINMHP